MELPNPNVNVQREARLNPPPGAPGDLAFARWPLSEALPRDPLTESIQNGLRQWVRS